MKIAWIGGVERSEGQLKRVASAAGHDLVMHDGDMHGRGLHEIRAAVERADFVIVVTDVNSHGAAIYARRLCQKLGREVLVLRRCGVARFQQLLEAMAPQPALRAAS
jgi:hypothetical protein